jgi:DNA-binding winged helix-turn-helix (wHTH) protein/Tol biopolymer transport system component
MSLKQQQFFNFGEFTLDAGQRILRSADESEIPLTPKVFETLLVLVENHNVILDKDYLLKQIWPDAYVEEGSLARNISILRKALGESPDDQRYIQTIPKRGYRFVAPVRNISNDRSAVVVEEETSTQATFDVEVTGATPSGATVGSIPHTKRRYLQWTRTGAAIATIALTIAGVRWYRRAPDRQVMRLEMSVTPADSLTNMECPVVNVSPDGSRVVYVAIEGGTKQLYVRAMDSKEARPIPGTEGAYCTPFFSPDGQWLAFYSNGGLKKVFLNGGSPNIVLTGLAGVLGASWGDDGNIVFSAIPTGLQRVSSSGGSAVFVTSVDAKRGEVSHRWPVLLPGSKALLYTAGKIDGTTEIVGHRLDSGEKRVLIPGGTFPNYTVGGQLVYVQNGALMAVDFDAERLDVRGTPVQVEERVRQTGQGAAQFGFSSPGSLVYVPGAGPDATSNDQTLVWVDRQGNVTPTGAPHRVYHTPRLSPDGQRLVVDINGDAKFDGWLYDFSRNVLTRLTSGGIANRYPSWTPDGKRVVFLRPTNTGARQLFFIAADGSGAEEQILMPQSRTIPGNFSPDGSVLLVTVDNATNGYDIWALELSGTPKLRPFLQSPFAEAAPVISPDGLWVAYVSNESGRNEIYVRPFSGDGQRWQISTEGGEEPVWAHSGMELFYINDGNMLSVPIMTSGFPRKTVVAGSPRVLFDARNTFRSVSPMPSYDVSSDDQRFLMIRVQTANRINVVLNLFDEFR